MKDRAVNDLWKHFPPPFNPTPNTTKQTNKHLQKATPTLPYFSYTHQIMAPHINNSNDWEESTSLSQDDPSKSPSSSLMVESEPLDDDDATTMKPVVGILRRSSSISSSSDNSVHFIDDDESQQSIVTSTIYRPYTTLSSIPSLFYSPEDIKGFKREYRVLLKAQRVNAQRLKNLRESQQQQPLGSSCRAVRSTRSPSSSQPTARDIDNACESDSEDECGRTTTPKSSASSSYGGLFSSVYEAVFSGSSSYYQPVSPRRAQRAVQSNHFVDTLYLF